MTAALATSALSNAVALRDPHGTIVHSDRGSQFRSTVFMAALKRHGLKGSMGRVAAAGDNAAMDRSSRSCKRTCWTGNAGPPEKN